MSLELTTKANKTLVLVESDAVFAMNFHELWNCKGIKVEVANGPLDLIQSLKLKGNPLGIVIEENSAPLNAIQTLDYLKCEMNIKVPIFISQSELNLSTEDYSNINSIHRPYTKEGVDLVISSLQSLTKNKPPVYSLEYLRSLSDDNDEFIFSTLQIFNSSLSEKFIELNDSLSQNNYTIVKDIAHNIKPSFAMLESYRGSEICDQIVYNVADEEIPDLVNQLYSLFSDIKFEINGDFPNLKW